MFYFILSLGAITCACIMAADTILMNQTIRDGQTIVSPQQTFELGFCSPGNTSNRYVAIWFNQQATGTIVWVANRDTPIKTKSGVLTLNHNGVLVIHDSATNVTIWSSTSSRTTRKITPVAKLLDSGNLMVMDREEGPENYIWQSFDYPGDTALPGSRFGRNVERGVVTNYTSWKSVDDPSKGMFVMYMDFNGLPQVFKKKGDVIRSRRGSWNGVSFSGNINNEAKANCIEAYVSNERETYTVFHVKDNWGVSMMKLLPMGIIGWYKWNNVTQEWVLYGGNETVCCDAYAMCGGYGSCDNTLSTVCGCLKGFKRRNDKGQVDWSGGCEREVALDCGVGEGFRRYPFMKLPDTRRSWFDKNMSLAQCNEKCKNECNCTAYAALDMKYGSGCLLWYDELVDMRTLPNGGQDIYIRMAELELEKDKRGSRRNKSKLMIIVIITCLLAAMIILIGICFLIIRKRRQTKLQETHGPIAQKDVLDLPMFSLSTLHTATNNFSVSNKLGQGGFGPVYKGFLKDGREVAVKRLSSSSSQGIEEFTNEVIFMSRLQHRNLVKILIYCFEGQEKMLVYEYMPNKSLDLYLFHEPKSKTLHWSQRLHIIDGIARGLLYLHQDSRLRIVHRDLKAANILLDHNMNPKISDFGLARSFGGNETETTTKKVIGTCGYLSPEYAGNGIFSVKSDVFSFGVLMLEILSGIQNKYNVLGRAWNLYKEGKVLEFVVSSFTELDTLKVSRLMQVGLLCVQNKPEDRPHISTAIMMLGSDTELPEPNHPGFYTESTCASSPNLTITLPLAR